MTKAQYSKKFTDEERAAYKAEQREQAQAHLEAAVAELQSTDGFNRWLEARARFHSYSFNNTLLIVAQCPEATRVASGTVWKSLDRHPAKGSKALRVFAPIKWAIPCSQGDNGAYFNQKKDRWERQVSSFKLVPVFDLSQTEGADLPQLDVAPLSGDSHAGLEPKLVALADDLGFSVSTEKLPAGTGGYCDADGKRIVIAEGHSGNHRVRVLVHEIAHALGIDYEQYGRHMAEVLVESVTYIVLAGQGLEATTSSVPYVASWAGTTDVAASLRKFAETIDEVARRIERAIEDTDQVAEAA